MEQCLWECENSSFNLIILSAALDLKTISKSIGKGRRENGRRTLILATAEHIDNDLRKSCLQAGIGDIIIKPLNLEKLSAHIDTRPHGM
jgi:DNA-binding response OmpR family regulator